LGSKKERPKTFDEEGVTGRVDPNTQGRRTYRLAVASGSGEHAIDDTTSDGFTDFQTSRPERQLQGQEHQFCWRKLKFPLTARAGNWRPLGRLYSAAVDAIKKYVEGGGRALIMLGSSVEDRTQEISDNDALTAMLNDWGVSAEKNLVLDDNPVSQLVGVGPEVPLITSYESHPIVNDLAGKATGFL